MNSNRSSGRGMRIAIAILLLSLLTLFSQPLLAQSQNISGTVIDTSGATIPDATVKINDVSIPDVRIGSLATDG